MGRASQEHARHGACFDILGLLTNISYLSSNLPIWAVTWKLHFNVLPHPDWDFTKLFHFRRAKYGPRGLVLLIILKRRVFRDLPKVGQLATKKHSLTQPWLVKTSAPLLGGSAAALLATLYPVPDFGVAVPFYRTHSNLRNINNL